MWRKIAEEKWQKEQERHKNIYDQKSKQALKYEIGDLVKIRLEKVSSNSEVPRLSDNWELGWKIKAIKENGSYLVVKNYNGKDIEKKVHESQMLKWYDSSNLHNSGLVNVQSSLITTKSGKEEVSDNENNNSNLNFGPKVTEPISSLLKNREEERLQDEYEVEKILDKEIDPVSKQISYLVKWKGYSDTESTWERIENLKHSKQAIADFENREKLKDDGSTVKMDDPEYVPGKDNKKKSSKSTKDNPGSKKKQKK